MEKRRIELYETDDEYVTVWSYVGLVFMGIATCAMAACVLWMLTW